MTRGAPSASDDRTRAASVALKVFITGREAACSECKAELGRHA